MLPSMNNSVRIICPSLLRGINTMAQKNKKCGLGDLATSSKEIFIKFSTQPTVYKYFEDRQFAVKIQ